MKKIILAIIATLMMTTFSPAQAETGYRYWSFWLNNGGWNMAQEGAGTLIPKDGDIQGWRYITSPANTTIDYAPRSNKTFEDICGEYPAESDSVRVAVIIDFGNPEDYSSGAELPDIQESCSIIKRGDTSASVLQAFSVRDEGGMVCGIDNLPATGCGEEVDLSKIKHVDTSFPYAQLLILTAILFILGGIRVKRKK